MVALVAQPKKAANHDAFIDVVKVVGEELARARHERARRPTAAELRLACAIARRLCDEGRAVCPGDVAAGVPTVIVDLTDD